MTEDLKEDSSMNLNIDDVTIDKNGKLTHMGWRGIISNLLKINPLWIRKFNQNKDVSEEDKITAVKTNPMILNYIQNPSEAVQKAAVSVNPEAFRFIKKPSEEVARAALFSKPALEHNGYPIWDRVKKKFKTFSNSLASELADSDVYAQKAYEDYGIYRNNIKTSKGFLGLGQEKQKGGELVNNNSMFNKIKRKITPTPQSVKNANIVGAAKQLPAPTPVQNESLDAELYNFCYTLLNESTKDYINQ